MTFRLVTSSTIEPWYEEWKRLWHAGNASPFLHPGWHLAFVQACGDDIDPLLIGVHDGDSLLGLLPMRRDPDGVLRFLSAPRADYEDVLVPAPARDEVVALLAGYLLERRFSLGEVPEGSSLANALQVRGLVPTGSGPCPGIQLTPESVKDLTGRSSIRRHQRKLARHGSVELLDVPTPDAVTALGRLMRQHIARRLAADDESLFLEERNRDFYRHLVTRTDFREFGCFHVLRVDTLDAAYHVGLVNRESFIWYKPTFDMNLAAEGPGEVLLKCLFEYADSRGMSYFDFSRGAAAFKSRFSNEVRRNLRFSRRLPILPRIRAGLVRRLRRMTAPAAARARRVLQSGRRQWPDRTQPVQAPATLPPPPEGTRVEFGEVDLVAFGALRLELPGYATAQRMRLAQGRRRRGDRMLIVRRDVDCRPVHVAWLCLQPDAADQAAAGPTAPVDAGRAEIFDTWTAAESRGSGIDDWSARYLSWQASQLGMQTSVHLPASGSFAPGLAEGGARASPFPASPSPADR